MNFEVWGTFPNSFQRKPSNIFHYIKLISKCKMKNISLSLSEVYKHNVFVLENSILEVISNSGKHFQAYFQRGVFIP